MATAIAYTAFGGPEVLETLPIDEPTAGEGQIVIAVEAVGVNPIDAKLRSGLRKSSPPQKPRRVGSDAAGVIAAVGDGVDGARVGDRVAVFGASGAYASHLVVAADKIQPLPAGVSFAVGAALGIPVATAYQSLRSLGVGPGDVLLVHGGSGSVGQAAIQFAVLWGATVVATASPRRFDRVRDLGAVPVAYGDGLEGRVREAAPQGVSVILDAAGTDEALHTSLELLADRSRIATLVRGADAADLGIRAFSGGAPDPLTPQQLAWRAEAMPVVTALLAAGRFEVELGPELPLADAAEAHRLVEKGVDGKIVLVP